MDQPKRSKKKGFQSGDLSFKKKENLSEEQNKALAEEFDYFIQKNAYGGQRIEGDYLVAYTLEFARKLTYPGEGDPHWQDLHEENAHIGIAVHEAIDLHFIKGLTITLTVIDKAGYPIGPFEQPLLERPNLYHYGRNWKLPGDGVYTLRVRVDTPENKLKDEKNGKTHPPSLEVEFRNVTIKTGQKTS